MSPSVVILSFGRDERFRPLLRDLNSFGVSPADILVVHNPYDPSDDWLPSPPRGVTVSRMPTNVGYGAAMNAGIDAIAGRSAAVLLLTHETRLGRESLPRLMAAFESAPEYGVLGPAVEYGGQLAVKSFGGTIVGSGEVGHLHVAPAVDHRGVTEVAWIDGCAMLVRMEALRDVGPLRAGYFMYFEEPELCDRMRACGWRVGVVPAATAYSEAGDASRPAAFGYLFARNGLHWARAHHGTRFAARFALRQLRSSWVDLPKPGGRRFADGALRRYGYRMALGRCTGLVAGVLGSTGPPPKLLARGGDIVDPDG